MLLWYSTGMKIWYTIILVLAREWDVDNFGRVMWCVEGVLERLRFFFLKSFKPTLNESHDLWLILWNQHVSHPFQNHNNHCIHHIASGLHHLDELQVVRDIWHTDWRRLRLQPRRYAFFFILFYFTLLILDYAYKGRNKHLHTLIPGRQRWTKRDSSRRCVSSPWCLFFTYDDDGWEGLMYGRLEMQMSPAPQYVFRSFL